MLHNAVLSGSTNDYKSASDNLERDLIMLIKPFIFIISD